MRVDLAIASACCPKVGCVGLMRDQSHAWKLGTCLCAAHFREAIFPACTTTSPKLLKTRMDSKAKPLSIVYLMCLALGETLGIL